MVSAFLLILLCVVVFMSMITRPDLVLAFCRKWLAFALAWIGHGLISLARVLWPEWK